MTAPGDSYTAGFSASIATATKAALTAQESSRYPFDVYLWGIAGSSANCQYVSVATTHFQGQEITVPPISLGTVGHTPQKLPYQVRIPANTDIVVYGYQDSGGAEVVSCLLYMSKTPVQGIPVGKLFTKRISSTAGNGSYALSAVQTAPRLKDAPKLRILGGVAIGAGALTLGGGVASDMTGGSTKTGESGPSWPGLADVSVNQPVFYPTPEDLMIGGGDPYYTKAKDLSAGTVINFVYFGY